MSNDQSSGDNTYLFDSESPTEMARLIELDRMMTKEMGGALAGLPVLTDSANVLDLACGPGGWVLEVAYANPQAEIAGIDISKIMVDYARARARTQKLRNASFEVMNLLEPLDFPDNTFDLINARFLVAALPRDAWPRLLTECLRILRPGGILRLTEADCSGQTNSQAFERFMALAATNLRRLGYGFSPDGRNFGMTHILELLLRKAGFVHIEGKMHVVRFFLDSEYYPAFRDQTRIAFHQARSLLLNSGLITEEKLEQLYTQLEIEMLSPDFSGIWPYMSAWGQKP